MNLVRFATSRATAFGNLRATSGTQYNGYYNVSFSFGSRDCWYSAGVICVCSRSGSRGGDLLTKNRGDEDSQERSASWCRRFSRYRTLTGTI